MHRYVIRKNNAISEQVPNFTCIELRDAALARALQKTLALLAKEKGGDVSNWEPKPKTINFGTAGHIPWARRGTYMQVVELSYPVIRSRNILPPGQSEKPDSPHYSDQLEMYKNWEYKPMRYRKEDLK